MDNEQGVFEWEKELCELFRKNKEKKSFYITCNVSSEGLFVWVQFDKEDNWDWWHGELILTTLIKIFKLDNKFWIQRKTECVKV